MVLWLFESREAPDRRRFAVFQDQFSHHFAERWAVFEAVAGASADDPHILVLRMPVDNEVTVRSLLVLAYAGLDQGSVLDRKSVV